MRPDRQGVAAGRILEVFVVFLKLGLTAFGGPIAHLGYFRDEIVTRRGWVSDAVYAELVALCQFLPGPASSQVGFALGLMRAGWGGAIAAFVAFTLPSAVLLAALALSFGQVEGDLALGVLRGLKIVAVAIVAQAVLGMGRKLCPDRERVLIAVAAALMLQFIPGALGTIGAIVLGLGAGLVLQRGQAMEGVPLAIPVSRSGGVAALGLFALLLVGLPVLAHWVSGFWIADSFYRAGSLVFGGGHVVLPLLEEEMVGTGRVSEDLFLAGYGAAQAVPGPLFSFAAWLGAVSSTPPNGLVGSLLALLALFLPGFLILIAALPFWDRIRCEPWGQSALQGVNAAVVGILEYP